MACFKMHVLITVSSAMRDKIIGAAFGTFFAGVSTTITVEEAKIIEMIRDATKPGDKLIGLAMDDPDMVKSFLDQTKQLNFNDRKTTGLIYVVIDGVFMQQIEIRAIVNDQEVSEYHYAIPQIPGIIGPIDATPIGLIMSLLDSLMMPLGTRFPIIVMNLCATYNKMFRGVNEYFCSTASMINCVDMTIPGYDMTEAKATSHLYSHSFRGFSIYASSNLVRGNKGSSSCLYNIFNRLEISQYCQSNTQHIVNLVRPVNEISMIRLNFTDECLVKGVYALQFLPIRRNTDANSVEGDGICILFNSTLMTVEIYSAWSVNHSMQAKLKKCFKRNSTRKLKFYTTFTFDNFCMCAVDPVTQDVIFETVMDLDTFNRRDFLKNINTEQTISLTAVYNDICPLTKNVKDMVYHASRLFESKNWANHGESLDRYQSGGSDNPHCMSSSSTLNPYEEEDYCTFRTQLYSKGATMKQTIIPKASDALNSYNSLIVTTMDFWFGKQCPGTSIQVTEILSNKLAEPLVLDQDIIQKIAYNSAMIQTKRELSEVPVGSKIEIHTGTSELLSALYVGCSFEMEEESITGHNGTIIHPVHMTHGDELFMVIVCTVVPEMTCMVFGGFRCKNRAKMSTYIYVDENAYRLMVYNNSHDLMKSACLLDVDITNMILSSTKKGLGETVHIGSLVGLQTIMHYKIISATKLEAVAVVNDPKSPNFTVVCQDSNTTTPSGSAVKFSPSFVASSQFKGA